MNVQNGPIERVFRTIGFMFVLLPSFIFFMSYITILDLSFLSKITEPVVEFIVNNLQIKTEYLFTSFILGLLLLIWTQNRSYFVRIIATLIGLFTVIGISTLNVHQVLPINFSNIQVIKEFYQKIVVAFPRFDLVAIIVSVFIAYLILAYKKPERVSTKVVSSGLLLLVFAIFAFYLPTLVTATWVTSAVFLFITNLLYALSYVAISVGAIFGIIGIFRK